jgi:hypothetical protein
MGSFSQTSLKWKISCKCTFKKCPDSYVIWPSFLWMSLHSVVYLAPAILYICKPVLVGTGSTDPWEGTQGRESLLVNTSGQSFMNVNNSKNITWHCPFKGIVQRDITGVETRLKWSALMNYSVAKVAFWILNEHHHERSTKPVSAS